MGVPRSPRYTYVGQRTTSAPKLGENSLCRAWSICGGGPASFPESLIGPPDGSFPDFMATHAGVPLTGGDHLCSTVAQEEGGVGGLGDGGQSNLPTFNTFFMALQYHAG